MADVVKLRDFIVELARDDHGPLGGKFNINDLYARLSRHFAGSFKSVPVTRGTFYAWFDPAKKPSQGLLECVPALATILGVPEYELWQAASILPPPSDASLALASSAHEVREAHRRMRKTLSQSGLSTAGEALVVDRILHHKLDFHMEVWPVVRGYVKPLHLHSWIVLKPVSPSQGVRRIGTRVLDRAEPAERREYIRQTVITESLWRALGLKFRDNVPKEFAHLGPDPLFIEVPVEERNRTPPLEPLHERFEVGRILVLGAPWAHAELMAALLAEALAFGSWDLRYIGYPADREQEFRERFCRERLAHGFDRYVWAIAQRFDLMHDLREDIVAAAPGTLVVVVTYGPEMAHYAATALGGGVRAVRAALKELGELMDRIEEHTDVVRVHLDDADVTKPATGRAIVDRHDVADVVRHVTAEVLNLLYLHRRGPGLPEWGDRFEDLRQGDEPLARLPGMYSTVEWRPRSAGRRQAG